MSTANTVNELNVLKSLNALMLGTISITDRSDLFWYVARDLVETMGFSDCAIYEADSTERCLRQVAVAGNKNPAGRTILHALEIQYGSGVTGGVAVSGQPCIVGNVSENADYIRDIDVALSEICVPFFIAGKVAGVIDCEDLERDKFNDCHLETLSAAAAILGVKLDLFQKEDLLGQKNAILQSSQERFALAIKGASDGLWDWDLTTDEVYYSPRWFEMLGHDPSDFPATLETWAGLINPADKDRILLVVGDCVSGVIDRFDVEFSMRHKDGSWVDILSRAFPASVDGETVRLVGTHVDITKQKRTENALRKSEERYKLAVQQASVWDYDLVGGDVFVSSRFGDQLGYSAEEFSSILEHPLAEIMHPDDVAGFTEQFGFHLETPNTVLVHELRYQAKNGDYKWFLARGQLILDGSNMPIRSVGLLTEITEQKALESSLRQAQKMEAVGQLTGGIAHDFNNLLAVIQGNAELLQEVVVGHTPMIAAIVRASVRGAELTHRLLAFSRRQPLSPTVFNMSELVRGMTDLLERALGGAISIEVISTEDSWCALADPGQVENALLNLSINARDAMPDGGELTIECEQVTLDEARAAKIAEVSTGDYVVLSVTDHGTGMPEEVQQHAFEPFFTTKETGTGTGLGLSMVYGFARQSGGQATIYSEEGKGTTIKLYLPRALSDVDVSEPASREAVPSGHGEIILVIEDDPEVRNLAELMLKKLNYIVLCAEDTNAARKCIDAHLDIAAVLSDVILPGGMSGPEFAEELTVTHPKLKVIFMSGYPAEAAKRNGFLGSGNVLLNKPFRIADLAKTVKSAMG